ncbi:MAG: M56 family metallopeptidase, partial [Defluviitaleaceae bacterium]|nr:M56 family metallopeptidase [Defluviitaleaceae bacterium]
MDMVFLTILNMSLTGAFVILAIWLARIPLRKAPKIISYCLWAVAGFRLVFPFSVEGLFSLIPFGAQPIPLDITHGVAVDIPTHSPPVMSNANIYNAHGVYSFPDFSYANILGGSGTESLGGGGFSELPHIATVANPLVTLVSIGTYVWFFGALVMLLYGLVSYFLLKQRLKNCTPDAQKIYTTDDIKSPFVLGFFSPKIYLPLNLPESEREYIILHEQTHIRRYDHIIKFVAYIILCLHWFNPLVWSAFSLMSKDMEMSCDERVLKELGSTIKKSYSMSLLSLATEGRYASSPLAFGEHGIKERVKNVLNFKRHSKIFVGVVVLLTVIFGAGFMFSRTDAAHTEEEFILGYFPTHDASIVTFAENARISLYLEDTPIDLRGRNIYPEPSFSGNFHTVYLPVEPVFDAIGLEYDWNEIRNIFRILGTANEHLTLRPDSPSWGATQINFLPGSPNQPSLLLRKDSGFYLHSNAFNSILGEYPFSGYYGETFYGIAQSWTPLIYHDLEKVILVTNAEIRNPHFERKHWLMVYQFMRAEHPILDTISVWINTHVGDDVLSMRPPTEEVTLETGQPFVVTTRISDYVMLPLVEILELLELDFSINEY